MYIYVVYVCCIVFLCDYTDAIIIYTVLHFAFFQVIIHQRPLSNSIKNLYFNRGMTFHCMNV